jgi:myo-inositol catabolism protein IolC
MRKIGYPKPLFVQPFDHRASFTKSFFGFEGAPRIESGEDLFDPVVRAKTLIYRGLLRAIDKGVEHDHVGVLVDSQFGSQVIADAQSKNIHVALCVEKSGVKIFDFEYGPRWLDHLRFVHPDMVKVLVRFHPGDDPALNHDQMARLKLLSDTVHSGDDYHFMFELLVPPLTAEEKSVGVKFDEEIRPRLMIEAIGMLQDFGVEPDIWKIEGVSRREDAEAISAQTRSGEGRRDVACILLGRGSDKEQVFRWLRIAAPVPGFIGFAVGRTNFAAPLKGFLANPSSEDLSIEAIANNFKECVDVWKKASAKR